MPVVWQLLSNNLENPSCVPVPPGHVDDPSFPHGFSVTNLHVHGLHVSPRSPADDVLTEVTPGSYFNYQYQLPRNHVAGTFWYHAHKHGSVALQVTGGMAGALLVRGGLDKLPAIKQAHERLFVLQQTQFELQQDGSLRACPEVLYSKMTPQNPPLALPLTLVNGQIQPKFRMRPKAIERWRFIHAGITEVIQPQVVTFAPDDTAMTQPKVVPIYEIAIDGIPRPKMTKYDAPPFAMYPGYRWDVLFQAPDAPNTTYYLRDAGAAAPETLQGAPTPPQFLAVIEVEQNPAPGVPLWPTDAELQACIPDALSPIDDYEVGARKCKLVFGLQGLQFLIDGQPYDPKRLDRVARLGTAEEWSLQSTAASHPFHIHVNPFEQLIFDSTGKVTDRIWRDTVRVAPNAPATVRMRFRDFAGETVLHCHRLDHEDQGMMEKLRILDVNEVMPANVRIACPPLNIGAKPAASARRLPPFQLKDGKGIVHRSEEFSGKPLVVVLFRGLSCLHCVQQLKRLDQLHDEFAKAGITAVAISTDDDETLATAYASYAEENVLPFDLLANGDLGLFRSLGCFASGPLHGTFVVDQQGKICWQTIGQDPYMDIDAVLLAARTLTKAVTVSAASVSASNK
jgi:FtsP/CotA-like multicopper oxidase with cupredoxin domain/peroxiredoxin